MISLQEAQEIIISKAKNFGSESVALDNADGRVLDEDILSDRDYPPFNRSAMDGYAIRYEDWQNNIRKFEIAETIFAGSKASTDLSAGNCYKIMTGSAVPQQANAVIRREDSTEDSGFVTFQLNEIKQYQNIAKQGEDLRKDNIAIRKNTFCSAPVISTLATVGKMTVPVKRLPKVAFFTTGNEVKPANSAVNTIEIRNSNEWLVKTLLKKWKIIPFLYQHINDDKSELQTQIRKGLEADILILSGGVSAGDADYVPEILQELGVKKLFHKVEIRPGKPFWCGQLPNGGMVFALPGNPFSTLVTFKLFIETYLEAILSHNPSKKLRLNFNGNRIRKSPFDEFFPVKITDTQLELIDINGSGDIRLGLYADGIAHHPKENPELSPGISIDCIIL